MRCTVVRTVALFALLLATAAAGEARGTIAGEGARSCADYTRQYQDSPDAAEDRAFSWAQGYLSALNEVRAQRFAPIDLTPPSYGVQDQKQFLRAYCASNPQRLLHDAARQLYTTLFSKQAGALPSGAQPAALGGAGS